MLICGKHLMTSRKGVFSVKTWYFNAPEESKYQDSFDIRDTTEQFPLESTTTEKKLMPPFFSEPSLSLIEFCAPYSEISP